MKRAAMLLLALPLLSACDEDKPKAEPAPSAASSAAEAPAPSAALEVAAAPAAVVKPPKECGTGPEVLIDDPDFEAEVRLKLRKPKDKHPGPLTAKDLAAVTSLNLTKKASLDELDPCLFPKLTGLKFLYLPKGTYRDLTPIQNLTKLEALRASISEVEDLSPLEKLVNLDQLDLGRTHVRDISSLGKLVNLTELALDDTHVSDLSPLATVTKLEVLSIKNTRVTDVRPLQGMKKLRTLNVAGTAVNNLNALEPLRARGLRLQTN